MDNALFSKYFFFTEISRKSNFHTDNSHGISCNFLGRLLSGRARIVCEGDEELELFPGDVFYFPFGLKYHSYWYTGSDGVRFESFRFDFYPLAGGRRFCPQKLYPTPDEFQLFDQMSMDKSVTPTSVGRLYCFFGAMMPRMRSADPDPKRKLFLDAQEYISGTSGDFKVPELARHLGMSESGVYAFFRSFGTTPIEVKNEMLAERARTLLISTDLSVEEICDRVGLGSVAYFRKLLRRMTGKTPVQIRREQRGTSEI